jgi:hypothetical protein
LREMAEAPHPLKYIRRFVVLQEDIVAAQQARPAVASVDPPIPSEVPAVSPGRHTVARPN